MKPWQRQKGESRGMLGQAAKKLLDVVTVQELHQIAEVRKCFETEGKAIEGVLGA